MNIKINAIVWEILLYNLIVLPKQTKIISTIDFTNANLGEIYIFKVSK